MSHGKYDNVVTEINVFMNRSKIWRTIFERGWRVAIFFNGIDFFDLFVPKLIELGWKGFGIDCFKPTILCFKTTFKSLPF